MSVCFVLGNVLKSGSCVGTTRLRCAVVSRGRQASFWRWGRGGDRLWVWCVLGALRPPCQSPPTHFLHPMQQPYRLAFVITLKDFFFFNFGWLLIQWENAHAMLIKGKTVLLEMCSFVLKSKICQLGWPQEIQAFSLSPSPAPLTEPPTPPLMLTTPTTPASCPLPQYFKFPSALQ